MIKALLCLTLLLGSASTQALGLLDAYALALRNDPTFQAAISEHSAGQQAKDIAQAGLLPALSYSYNNASNQSEVSADATRASRDYRSYNSHLSVQQPLFDYAAWVTWRQGVTRSLMADQRLRARSHELAARVFGAYSQALLSTEHLRLAQARSRSHEQQLHRNKRLLAAGEGTRTDVLETQARHSLAQAETIEAQDSLQAALQHLQAMLGEPVRIEDLAPLRDDFSVPTQPNAPFEHWRDLAMRHSPALSGQQHGVQAAELEIQRQRAGHLPTLALYANSRTSRSDSQSNYNQQHNTDSVGLRLHLPLYAGGRVAAATRQAVATHRQASFEFDAARSALIIQLREQFNRSVSSEARIDALEIASASARLLIAATRKSVAGGERVNLDVLNAEQQHYSAQRDLAGARHAYLLAWLQLRVLAGQLESSDLERLDRFFG